MISNHWIALRKESWSRLETLVQQVEAGGLKTLSPAELREFGLLYRQSAADLSAVRTDEGSRTLEAYLNGLVSRAHNHIYSGDRMSLTSVWRFLAQDLPENLSPAAAVYDDCVCDFSCRGTPGNDVDGGEAAVYARDAGTADGGQD